MKSLSVIERACITGGVALFCFVAGYLSNGSAGENELRSQAEADSAKIKTLTKTNQELSERVSSLVADISELKRSGRQVEIPQQDEVVSRPRASVQVVDRTPEPTREVERTTAQKIEISEIGTTLVNDHGESSKYLDVAFKTRLTNNNGVSVKINVKFVLLSAEGFELDAEPVYDPTVLPAGGSEVVTTTSMLTKSVYERMKSVEVRIRLE